MILSLLNSSLVHRPLAMLRLPVPILLFTLLN